ncbi:MAG: pseudouridine synthase [Chitinophagaceae bacterium]
MAKAKAFDKFINKPVKGAKIKEAFRQEKKTAVRERREAIEKHFEEKRRVKAENLNQQGTNENRSFKGEGKKPFGKNPAPKPPYKKPAAATSDTIPAAVPARKFEKPQPKTPFKKPFENPPVASKTSRTSNGAEPKAVKPDYNRKSEKNTDIIGGEETAPKRDGAPSPRAHKRPYEKKGPVVKSKSPVAKNDTADPLNYMDLTPEELAMSDGGYELAESTDTASDVKKKARINPAEKYKKKEKVTVPAFGKTPARKKESGECVAPVSNDMPLNKFLAHAGLCSRRDAADIIKKGTVTVNGTVVTEPGFKVTDDADVKVEGKPIKRSKNLVYILMNKPKDYITTAEDPQGRKTVMDIIKNATTERVYPVGRLDRNTSGVLLLTNDGDLAQKLSHPSFEVRKIYEVRLDKILQKDDFEKILSGVKLEDGEVHADSLAYGDKDKSVVGIEIHSGKNRVVRRIFETLGYDVRGLDRVMYANLTKKNVERGKWRFLNDKEVRLLKYFNKSKQKQ